MKQHYFIELTLEDYLPIREVIESSRKYAEQNGNRDLIKYSREILTKLDTCFQNKLEKKLNK